MSDAALKKSQDYAHTITKSLGGNGLFGVEFFIKGDDVYFSEVSPRPHDTGLVTLISQDISEFALHARAILGLPIPGIRQMGNAASSVILVEGESSNIEYSGIENALKAVDTQLRLFGKPEVSGTRRMGVGLALGESVDEAITKAKQVSSAVSVKFLD
jgi:phosphoribosylglycinamide formyltransferase 2